MKYHQVRLGPFRALAVQPREATFGHQVVEVTMGLHLARHLGVALCLVPPARVANDGLFALECEEVPILSGLSHAIVCRLADAAARRSERALEAQRAAAQRAGQKFKPGPPDFHGVDFRERYIRDRLTVRLRPDAARRAAAGAAALGITPDARIVTVHARESGFKLAEGGESAADAIRNARIETYLEAVDLLVSRGFTVVRVGDPTMTPMRHPGLVDVATSPHRTGALELSLMMRAVLQIAGDSGPYCVSYLTGTPCLAVNVTNVIGGYPLRAHDRYILKHVFDSTRGRRLTLQEMLTQEFFDGRKDLDRYTVSDNTAAEIRDAVAEMLDVLDGRVRTSPEQREYRLAAQALQQSPAVAAKRVRKGEPAEQPLGDGLIARQFAEAFLSTPAETTC